MNIGLIARADNTGLGMQTWEFYRHMEPVKTMVVDISKFNGNKQYPERYGEECMFIKGFPTDNDVRAFLTGLDCVFIAEAAYNPNLYNIAREMGVKTAVQYNYEFMDWLVSDYPKPDMFIAPSLWHYDDVQRYCERVGIKHEYLHCPVDREKLPRKMIKSFETFLHIAGKSAANDRNGTEAVIMASKHLKTGAHIIVHFQGEQGLGHQKTHTIEFYQKLLQAMGDPTKCSIRIQDFDNYQDLYHTGDAVIFPRRYGGNCLPLNEALSCGMPVLMPNISPNNRLLPGEWLMPAVYSGSFTPRTEVEMFSVDPHDIAHKIDEMFVMPIDEVLYHTDSADIVANRISWQTMAPKYREVFEKLCNQ